MQTATCGALGPRDVLLSCGLSGMAYAYGDRRPFSSRVEIFVDRHAIEQTQLRGQRRVDGVEVRRRRRREREIASHGASNAIDATARDKDTKKKTQVPRRPAHDLRRADGPHLIVHRSIVRLDH